jgi:uncharacterized protein (TIGR02217 family)
VAFFEVEFPTTISYKAQGGPGFSTIVNTGFSGQEQRNRNWARSRGKWTVSLITPASFPGNRQGFMDLLLAFFMVVGGKADAFRLKDHKDFKARSQPLVDVGAGPQLGITRTIGARSYVQPISKPITRAVNDYQGNPLPDTVFRAGTASPVTVDPTTGLVSGLAAGTLVDFDFHYPVRFESDDLPLQIIESNVRDGQGIGSLTSIQLIEVLAPNF